MRLIDADKLTASQSLSGTLYYPMTEIENAPTIDVERPTKAQFKRMTVQLGYEQVVRCKDCKYFDRVEFNCKGFKICPASGMDVTPEDYCSYGEREDQ